VKRYEGLFILDLTGKEEGLNEAVDKVKSIIVDSGAKVETVQKMDKKPFARVTDKKFPAGHYINFVFEIQPAAVAGLKEKFRLVDEVYRVSIGNAAPQPAAK
jgi:small subunit ribosomal protein S6